MKWKNPIFIFAHFSRYARYAAFLQRVPLQPIQTGPDANWPNTQRSCTFIYHSIQLLLQLKLKPIGLQERFYIDLPTTQIYSNKPYLEHSIQSPCVHCTCKCCTKISHKLCAVKTLQSMNKCCTVEEMLHNNNLIICCTTNICCTKTICDKIANLLTIAKGSIKK